MSSTDGFRGRIGGGGVALADPAIAVGLFTVSIVVAFFGDDLGLGSRGLDLLGAALLAAIALPVCWRRRWPLAMLALSVLASVPYHALGYAHEVAVLPVLVLTYTVGLTSTRRQLAGVLVTVGLGVALVDGLTEAGPPGIAIVQPLGWLLAAAVTGQAVRLHRAYVDSIKERADRAERTREEEAARRVAEERLRIARDVHDVLAHHVAVINANAGVAAHLLTEHRDDPAADRLATPLRTIADTSSVTLAELRTTLDVLRGNDLENERRPTPGLERIPDLLQVVRGAGLTAAMEVDGDPLELTPAAEIALYRIAQEALTNVAKHADAAHVTVGLTYADDGVRLAVADDGRGPPNAQDVPGYGILGMTERAASVGGTLVAGAGDHGGFRVIAHVPAREAR